ncbi:hypothetical protein I4U23_012492 [Adineta vaga]|nr:hypothetical protein I4U23_012492 [Adineta vaga]
MKSDLNIDTLPNVHHRHRRLPIRTNSNVNIPISSSTKAITKQSTNVNEDVKGIEGNAIRIETFPKFRQQFDLPETQFISLSKSHSFIQERPVKQVQALTEYQFSTPTLLRTKKTVDDIDLINQSRQRFNSLEQQRSPDMRRQGSHKKSVTYIDKQIYTCHKLNINDTIHQETIIPLSKHPSVNFIFPYMRPCRYLTQLTSPSNPINSDSFKQHTDYNAMQSIRNSIEYDDDLHNPQNTIINFNMNQDMQ